MSWSGNEPASATARGLGQGKKGDSYGGGGAWLTVCEGERIVDRSVVGSGRICMCGGR